MLPQRSESISIKMKIAVNTRLLLKDKLEGIGWFSHEVLKRICQQHPEHQFYFFFDRKWSDEFIYSDNVKPVLVHPQARHPVLWYMFFEWGVPYALNKSKADLFFSPDGWVSLKSGVKQVNVIHDINFFYHPEHIKASVLTYYKKYFPQFARKSHRIATVSEFTRNTIIETFNTSPSKIDVVYNGVNEAFKPMQPEQKEKVKTQYAKQCEYFFFVGLIHPRKNLQNIFKAFDLYKKETGNSHKLVIAGDKKWWSGVVEIAYNSMAYKDEVIFTGRLEQSELCNVMAAAHALLYVSYFEGFGIPIIEAFRSGTPVITSNVTSMPEVAAGAALLANPDEPQTICDRMLELQQPLERKSCIQKGLKRAEDFSWDQTALKTWNCIEKAMSDEA